ncbi:PilI type IV pilus biogenesis protein [Escherichia coli]|nr:PilI type IV pilus biogenesis protein [Escherichia coli]
MRIADRTSMPIRDRIERNTHIYTNTCEKKVICIPATEDINIAIMPFQTADNALIIVCQNTRIIRRTERIPGSCSEWKEVALPP